MNGFVRLLVESGIPEKEAEEIANTPSSVTLVLSKILATLREMKQQEFDYWEAWKKAKVSEQQKNGDVK